MADDVDLIVSAALIDNLVFADGSQRRDVPGGAGLYALAGAALFSDAAILVTGAGTDLPHTFGPWMDRNGLSPEGLRLDDDHTPRNVLRYIDDHSRIETPVYGASHFARLEPRPSDLAPFAGRTRSVYVFRNLDPVFWSGFDALAFADRPLILWEIALDACEARYRTAIEARLEKVDALSLNLDEARRIFAVEDEDAIAAALADWPVPVVFLRLGARGSLVVADGLPQFVPSLPAIPADVTGGGNAYSGAATIGLAQRRSAREAAAMGTAAASLAIAQYGPPEAGGEAARAQAEDGVRTLLHQMEEAAAP